MRILMLVPVWRRPEMLRLFIDSMERNLPTDHKLIPLFVLSPEDPDYMANAKLTRKYNCFTYSNEFLGAKKNAGLKYAMRFKWDYLMDMGSDDVWTSLLWQLYKSYFKDSAYFGLSNMYVYDVKGNRAIFIRNYHIDVHDNPTALGVGRCVHRDIITAVGVLWRDGWNCGMDGSSHFKITERGYDCKVIDSQELPVICDIKTDVALTHWQQFFAVREKSIPVSWILEKFNIPLQRHTLITFNDFRTAVVKEAQQGTQGKAFEKINKEYRDIYGKDRYKNYEVYLSMVSKKRKNGKL